MKPISLGPLEQEVMKCVWHKKSCTTREVLTCLSQSKKIAYNTIQTVMTRLFNKGLLKRTFRGKTYIYESKKKKENTLKSAINKSMSSFLDQFGEDALVAFVDGLDNISAQTRLKLIKKLQQN